MTEQVCPFCEQTTMQVVCSHCNRNITSSRNICKNCKKMTPANEPSCSHCGRVNSSELTWKIPLIIGIFIAATILSIAIRQLAD